MGGKGGLKLLKIKKKNQHVEFVVTIGFDIYKSFTHGFFFNPNVSKPAYIW